VDQTERLWTIF